MRLRGRKSLSATAETSAREESRVRIPVRMMGLVVREMEYPLLLLLLGAANVPEDSVAGFARRRDVRRDSVSMVDFAF